MHAKDIGLHKIYPCMNGIYPCMKAIYPCMKGISMQARDISTEERLCIYARKGISIHARDISMHEWGISMHKRDSMPFMDGYIPLEVMGGIVHSKIRRCLRPLYIDHTYNYLLGYIEKCECTCTCSNAHTVDGLIHVPCWWVTQIISPHILNTDM